MHSQKIENILPKNQSVAPRKYVAANVTIIIPPHLPVPQKNSFSVTIINCQTKTLLIQVIYYTCNYLCLHLGNVGLCPQSTIHWYDVRNS